MTAVDLLANLGARGVRLTAHGDRLAYDAPAGAMTPDLLEQLAAYKGELLALLGSKGSSEQLAQVESHADREFARFLEICRARPDGRGWYDPGAPWAVIQHLDAASRAMAAQAQTENNT